MSEPVLINPEGGNVQPRRRFRFIHRLVWRLKRLHREGRLWSGMFGMVVRRLRWLPDRGKTVKVFCNDKVLTVRQCSKLLGVKIPTQYRAMADKYIDQTDLFDSVDDHESIVAAMWSTIDKRGAYSLNKETVYRRIDRDAASFRHWYGQSSFDHDDTVQMLRCYLRYRFVFAPAGFSAENYFTLGCFDRSFEEASQLFITTAQAFHFTVYRDKDYIKYFNNKVRFLATFSAFVNRDWLDMRQTNFEQFNDFCQRHGQLVTKPLTESQGLGIGIVPVPDSPRQRKRLYAQLVHHRLLIEQVIDQHVDLALVNESSLNTVRVHTIRRPNGQVDVVSAYVRFGHAGSMVDNFHSHGVAAMIDVATGITTTGGRDLAGGYFELHPDSHIQLCGFQVPCWHKVIAMATAAALVVPQVHHVGWDIAITDQGEAEMVEGNSFPSLSTTLQILDGCRGNIKTIYQPYFDEFDQNKSDVKAG